MLKEGVITQDEFDTLAQRKVISESLDAEVQEHSPREVVMQEEEERVWREQGNMPVIEEYFTPEFLLELKKLPPPEYQRDEVSVNERRRKQLIQFYEQHNPAKLAQIDDLLANYKFADILASLRTAYGTVPDGWEEDQAVEALTPSKKKKIDEYARFRARTREHQQNLLENGIIEWKRRHPDGEFEQWLKSEMSGNIRFDDEGKVEWIDPRSGNLKFTFEKMRAFDPLHKIGEAPSPDDEDFDAEEEERAKRQEEIVDLF